jgi:hypothetical protein
MNDALDRRLCHSSLLLWDVKAFVQIRFEHFVIIFRQGEGLPTESAHKAPLKNRNSHWGEVRAFTPGPHIPPSPIRPYFALVQGCFLPSSAKQTSVLLRNSEGFSHICSVSPRKAHPPTSADSRRSHPPTSSDSHPSPITSYLRLVAPLISVGHHPFPPERPILAR